MPFTSSVKDEPEVNKYYLGFPKGLNTVQDESLIHDKNISEALNVILAVDGIERRKGTEKVFDTGSASKVYGAIPFYKKSAGTRKLLRIGNGRLQYLDTSSNTWSSITSHTFTNTMTTLTQARDKIFIYNGTENLRYYDGTSITEYTALTVPTNLAVAAQGTTGSTDYSYEVTAYNAHGETTACSNVDISDGHATLSATNYNQVTWTAVNNATGYNIYGRTSTGYGRVYIATITNGTTYNDTGSDSPVTSKLAPEANNTGGIIGKYAIFTGGRQYVAGVYEGSTYHPCRLYYSGTVQYIDSFVGAEFGGGWVDVSANDGGEIVDIKPYQNGVIIWKNNGLFKFYFTSAGLPAIEEITKSHGGVSFWASQEKDTDYIYVGQKENRIMVMTVGYQENYVGDQLRTNEISIFIQDDLINANRAYLSNIASFSYDNKFGFTYTAGTNTENDRGYVIDTRFGGWVKWNGDPMECTSYVVYDDGSNVHLYGCSNSDGYMIELFKNDRNDNGSAFTSSVSTKAWNYNMFDVEKIYRDPALWFKYVRGGSIDVNVYVDGTRKAGTAEIGTASTGSAIGGDLAGAALAGHTTNVNANVSENADVPRVLELLEFARSIKFTLVDNNLNSNWKFMGVHLRATPLPDKPLAEDYRVVVS